MTQVDSLLARLRTAFLNARGANASSAVACFAEKSGLCVKDPNCSPKRCAKASATFGPLFHLYSFTHQMRPVAKPVVGQAESPAPRRVSPPGLASSEPCDAATLSRGATERRHSAAEIYPESSQNESWTNAAPLYIFPDVPSIAALSVSCQRHMHVDTSITHTEVGWVMHKSYSFPLQQNLGWALSWSSLSNSRVSCEDLVFCLSSMSCEALKECIDFRMFSALTRAGLLRMADELPAAEEFFARAVDLDQMINATFARSAADVVRTVMALTVPADAPVILLVEEHALRGVQQVLSSVYAPKPPTAVMTAAALNQDLPDGLTRRALQDIVHRHCICLPRNGLKTFPQSDKWMPPQVRTPTAALSQSFSEDMKQTDISRSNEHHHAPYNSRFESYIANLTRDML